MTSFEIMEQKLNEFAEAVCDTFGADKSGGYTLEEIAEIWFGKYESEEGEEETK